MIARPLTCAVEVSDTDFNADTGGTPLIKGFILPTAPEGFIDKDIREQLGEEEASKVLSVFH